MNHPHAPLDAPEASSLQDSLRRSHLSESLTTGSLMSGSQRLPFDEQVEFDRAAEAEPVPVDLPRFPLGTVPVFFVGVLVVCIAVIVNFLPAMREASRLNASWVLLLVPGCIALLALMMAWRYVYRRVWFNRCTIVRDSRRRIIVNSPAGQATLNPVNARVEVQLLGTANDGTLGLLRSFALVWTAQNRAGKWRTHRHSYSLETAYTVHLHRTIRAFADELGVPLDEGILAGAGWRNLWRRHGGHAEVDDGSSRVGLLGKLQVFGRKIGGMGVVYFCQSLADEVKRAAGVGGADRRFVLKTSQAFLRRGERSSRTVQQFEHEAAMWLQLPPHRHIVEAFGVQRIVDVPYLVLDYVPGGSLSELLRARAGVGPGVAAPHVAAYDDSAPMLASTPSFDQPADARMPSAQHGRLTAHEVCVVGAQVALALQAAGVAVPGLVHGDVKPGNILVGDDTLANVKLTDFGLSAVAGLSGNAATLHGGTPGYLAPEAWERDAMPTPAHDVYALGVTLFECATGRLPFVASTLAAMAEAHRTQPVPALHADLPLELEQLIVDCMASHPADRPDIGEVAGLCLDILAQHFGEQLAHAVAPRIAESDAVDRVASLLELSRADGAARILQHVPAAERRVAWHYWQAVVALALGNVVEAEDWQRRAGSLNAAYVKAMGSLNRHVPTRPAGSS
ncbi:MAG: serine/threonine-protein kinase [Planctomycetota bacterium]